MHSYEQHRRENLKKIEEIIGEQSFSYEKKIAVLKKQFTEDNIMKRELSPLLQADISPMLAALVVDNLDQFIKMYAETGKKPSREESSNYKLKLLHMACACASTKVSNFLLTELGVTFTTEGYEHLLAYAAASKNKDWITSIAEQLVKEKKSMPQEIYDCSSETIRMIRQIFKAENPSRKHNPIR